MKVGLGRKATRVGRLACGLVALVAVQEVGLGWGGETMAREEGEAAAAGALGLGQSSTTTEFWPSPSAMRRG